jgi:hypothetical protein
VGSLEAVVRRTFTAEGASVPSTVLVLLATSPTVGVTIAPWLAQRSIVMHTSVDTDPGPAATRKRAHRHCIYRSFSTACCKEQSQH